MADNYPVKDGAGASKTFSAKDAASVFFPRHIKAPATVIDDLADITLNNGSETSLVAVDATRVEAIIVADPANTVAIRIGKTGQVGASRGAKLQPGQSITLNTSAAIYGYAGAASQVVSITLLKE